MQKSHRKNRYLKQSENMLFFLHLMLNWNEIYSLLNHKLSHFHLPQT